MLENDVPVSRFQRLRDRFRPRLGTILLLLQLLVLALPLAALTGLRIYESALIRQTENALVSQAAFIAAVFAGELDRAPKYGLGLKPQPKSCPPAPVMPKGDWQLRPPTLDLADDPVLPEAPRPVPASVLPLPWAEHAALPVQQLMKSAQKVTLSAMRLTDCFGTVIATTGSDLSQSFLIREEVEKALRGEQVSVMRARNETMKRSWASISRGARLRVTVVMPVEWQQRVVGAVLLERTPASVSDTLWGKRTELALGLALLVMLVALLAFLAAYFISGPIYALRRQVALALEGHRGAVVPLKHAGTVEVSELSSDVAELSLTLEERADYIARFAAQVSHEFKTPLTSVRGAVELLRDHAEMPEAQRQRFLGNLLADTDRLELLVTRLLELARADVLRPSGESCNASAVIREFTSRYEDRGLLLDSANLPQATEVGIAAELLGSIVANLLDNSLQHGANRVLVSATTVLGAEPAAISIRFQDNGEGVSPANATSIFDPFFTTSRDSGGTGLGLPTIKALAEAHGGELRLVSNGNVDGLAGAGACFECELPLA